MKPLSILLLVFLLGNQLTQAQDSKTMESFLRKLLTQYSLYFDKAEFTPNGQLSLSAFDLYFELPLDHKIEIIEDIASSWPRALIIVQGVKQNELWGKNSMEEKANMIDRWGLDPALPTIPLSNEPQRFVKHPWFFYIGEQGMMDSNHNLNMALNTRLGFFLLLNRWDLAATLSAHIMGTEDSQDFTSSTNTGLMSKVYFPIHKYNISPHIGAGFTLSSYQDAQKTSTTSVNKSILFGISWFVGFGSLDIGFRSGKDAATMVGFTIVPKLLNGKK